MSVAVDEDEAERGSIVAAMIVAGADVNAADNDPAGSTPLHTAAFNNCADVIALLVGAGANMDTGCTKDGDTPLHLACAFSQLEATGALLGHGADPDARNRKRQTPLHRAAANLVGDTIEVVRAQLVAGCDETIADVTGKKAEEVIGGEMDEADQDQTDKGKALLNDKQWARNRTWRRRAFMVMGRQALKCR